jgi:hypothetical protein
MKKNTKQNDKIKLWQEIQMRVAIKGIPKWRQLFLAVYYFIETLAIRLHLLTPKYYLRANLQEYLDCVYVILVAKFFTKPEYKAIGEDKRFKITELIMNDLKQRIDNSLPANEIVKFLDDFTPDQLIDSVMYKIDAGYYELE